MCGLTGYWKAGGHAYESAETIAGAMARQITHRGPDDQGVWIDASAGVALAHRRLSILDLSSAGHQPMLSASGRFVIVFNGEIYNHLALRREVETGSLPRQGAGGCKWRGHSDTETLLAAFDAWGVEATLKKTVGMFALALWDRETCKLTLARDRLGEKPLYFGLWRGVLLFASELKAIKAYPGFDASIDRDALTLYLRHNAIPAPYTIYSGIHKLVPGTTLTVTADALAHHGELPAPVAFWTARAAAEGGRVQPFTGSTIQAEAQLESLLRQSIAGQMVTDVPLGAFLSGGVDSSLVVALMQSQSSRAVKTFTIGFHEPSYNEAEHALAVAKHLGTEHTELYVTPDEARDIIPLLPALFDEPFADSSQIPTYLLARMTRQQVTVSLSGDGGDELFGGYNRYFWATNIWRKIGWMPWPLRAALAGVLTALPPQAWDTAFSRLSRVLPENLRYANPGDKLHKAAEILAARSPEEIYLGLVSHWKRPENVVIGGVEPATVLTDASRWADLPDFESRMMYLDQVSYLPDDILVKVDRAAMGVSLETRVPLLDHRVVEFAWRLPLAMKIRQGQGKWILRQVLYKYVPRELIERPKMGFGVPIDQWLRGPLRDWAETLLDESRLRREGYFEPAPIRKKWREHLSGDRNWAYYLWDVLMFQAWLETQGG
jgi:asparagine synthase (glutamine-hydrolysing)